MSPYARAHLAATNVSITMAAATMWSDGSARREAGGRDEAAVGV